MSRSGNLKKYLLIVRLLQENKQKALSLKTIQAHLESHGFRNISSRTLSRDFQALHAEFGIFIEHDPRKRGYVINTPTDEDLSDFDQFLKLLELAERVETIAQTLQSVANTSRSIIFEHNDFFKGSEYLKIFADAIQRKILVSYDYHSYQKSQPDKYTIAPYLIMEHGNRWYLLGHDQQALKVKTFGLDRMQQVQLLHPFEEKTAGFDYKVLFQHTYGITCLAVPPSRIVLSFTSQQGKYVKSLPLHHSQQILIDNEQELRISLLVVLNYDLKMKLLSYGSKVEVLEPLQLRQEIAEELQKSLKKYAGQTEFG